MSRVYTSHELWWWHPGKQHHLAYADVGPESGSWWLSDNLLVALGELSVTEPSARGRSRPSETAIMLLQTDMVGVRDSELARARLDAHALFPKLGRNDPAAEVIDTRPAGAETLLVLTKACPASHMLGDVRLQRPCMHRVGFRSPLHERLGREPMTNPITLAHRELDVRTLGPIDSYLSLAIASDGTRAAYVAVDPVTLDSTPSLFTVAIEQTSLGPVERVADAHRRSQLHLSTDGRVLVVESPVVIGAYGERPTARAFVLAPSDITHP